MPAPFLRHRNLVYSTSRRGNYHDKAMAGSFFNILKRERIRRKIYHHAMGSPEGADRRGYL